MNATTTPPSITIPDDAWRDTGGDDDPSSRLLASFTINGVMMHLEAYAVKPLAGPNDEFRLVDADADEALGLLIGDGFPTDTFERNGRSYAFVATPYSG